MGSGDDIYGILHHAAPLMPVLTIDDVSQGVSLAKALHAAGIRVIEVTLRTPSALSAIAEICSAFPDLLIGAGTVLNVAVLDDAMNAGAHFAVSPGLSREVISHAASRAFPFLPGVSIPSEMMESIAMGCEVVKLFPAIPMGGAAWLKAMRGPFPQLQFCPTGGIDARNVGDLLILENVLCVGGSWFIDAAAVQEERWDDIEVAVAKQLAELSGWQIRLGTSAGTAARYSKPPSVQIR